MKKVLIALCITLFLGLSPLLVGQTYSSSLKPEDCVIPTGFLLVEETFLKEVIDIEIKKAIDKAVDEAVAVAVKEEQKKYVDLEARYDNRGDEIVKLTGQLSDVKLKKLSENIIWAGGGLLVGTALGVTISFMISSMVNR